MWRWVVGWVLRILMSCRLVAATQERLYLSVHILLLLVASAWSGTPVTVVAGVCALKSSSRATEMIWRVELEDTTIGGFFFPQMVNL